MIELNKLNLTNFLSHVDTSLNMKDYEGLVLIEGVTSDGHYSSNGSGKSTILEGIVYSLTGDTLRGVSVNDVVNRNHKKNTRVSLDFLKDGEPYSVSRYRKDDKYGDSLVLMKGDEDISKRVNKETQKSLDDLLGISYKVLASTVLLGEGLSSRFTQLSDPEKKSLIESTLNLNYDMTELRSKANSKLTQLKLDKSNMEGRLSTLRELASLDVGATQELLEHTKQEEAEAAKQLSSLNESLAREKSARVPLENKAELLKESIRTYDGLESELRRLDVQTETYINEMTNAERSETPHCTLCHQSLVSEEARESFRNSYREKIALSQQEMENVRIQISNLPPRDILISKLAEIKMEINECDDRYSQINHQISNLTNTYWSLKSKVDSLQSELNRYHESTSDIDSLEKDYEEIVRALSKYEYFYKLFSPTGIVVNILADAIEYINTRLSTYSEVLLEKEYKINFVKGKISLIDSKGASYQSLSNGEKRRLDISIQFALHDYVTMYCGMRLDTVFIDEILDTLDDIGVENIFEVLRLKLEYCQLKSIYVITHNNTLKDKFDQVITIKKDLSGDSRLVN